MFCAAAPFIVTVPPSWTKEPELLQFPPTPILILEPSKIPPALMATFPPTVKAANASISPVVTDKFPEMVAALFSVAIAVLLTVTLL